MANTTHVRRTSPPVPRSTVDERLRGVLTEALKTTEKPQKYGVCSAVGSWTLTLDMATDSKWERLQLAALRLREIQDEANAIYRRFPELDRRPKSVRTRAARTIEQTIEQRNASAIALAKLH